MESAFDRQHVLSIQQYGRDDLETLFALCDEFGDPAYAAAMSRSQSGRVLVSAFFDRSTRTRIAHESAMLRLGGAVTGFADVGSTRAAAGDGESVPDTLRMLANYGDVIVCRHPATAAVDDAAQGLHVPVINGGDGTGEHPTQAMTDLYAIRSAFGHVDGLHVLLVNDLRMRCVRSLLRGLRRYPGTVGYLSSTRYPVPEDLLAECAAAGQHLVRHDDPRAALERADVVYSSPTVGAAGLVADGDGPADVLDLKLLDDLGRDTPLVLHPLPRGRELDPSLDGSRFDGYRRQAAHGVPVRMALLTLLLGARR